MKFDYHKIFGEYTKGSVDEAVKKLKRKGRLNLTTLDYYLKGKEYGGLGMGRWRKRMSKVM